MTKRIIPTPTVRRSRAPNGAPFDKRIFVSLFPEERDELIRLADLYNRTWSAQDRIYLVRGMKADPNCRRGSLDDIYGE